MTKAFISYSHKDEALRDELVAHLAPLRDARLIDDWYDRQMLAGAQIDPRIEAELESSELVLLLVSSAFLNSDYCKSKEMKRALERRKQGLCEVVPVILRDCLWEETELRDLNAVPTDGRAIDGQPNRDQAFTDAARAIGRLARELKAKAAAAPSPARSPQHNTATTARAVAAPPTAASQAARPLTQAALADSLFGRQANRSAAGALNIKREFTDQDRDTFARNAFERVCRYFEESLQAAERDHPDVTSSFERIDSRSMVAKLYRNGRTIATCSVRRGSLGGRDDAGLMFSHDASASTNSCNEMLTLETQHQELGFKTMMDFSGSNKKPLSADEAASHLWGMFAKQAR